MSSPPAYEVINVPAAGQPGREELRQQCYDVRVEVFHREQGFPLDTEFDEYDDEATHILLRVLPSHTPVGTIRCVKLKGYYKLTRLAVLKDYRQFRFGRVLVESLHAHVRAEARASLLGEPAAAGSTVKVVAHSQLPVKAFYGKFGYVPEGEEFDEDGAPHQKMVARLSLSD
ncbi:acyl-CoA N-acyltransferase [Trametes polyzona]|nr:acyl-CoA N-acyltransferase [Trametes polyzona]